MDIDRIFSQFYSNEKALLATVILHSECVARKALSCIDAHNLEIDRDFVYEAAMLHDIGVIRCNAPDILCHGVLPYICHGVEGKKMLDSLGLPKHALVCERHTGSGLSEEDIIRQNLPLPLRDMLPLSIEEKLICYADKFFSKSGNLTEEKSVEKIMQQMERHGQDSLDRFIELNTLFG